MSTLDQFLGNTAPPPDESKMLWPDKIQHLSASSLGMLRRCPEQFRQRYILGNKEKPGEAMVIGSIMHETLDFNYEQKITSFVDRPLAEVIEFLNDQAVPQVLEEDGGVDEIKWDSGDAKKGEAVARNDSERITTAYYKAVVPRMQPTVSESRFEIVDPRLPVPIIGYLDTIVGTMVELDHHEVLVPDRVIDVKSGKQSASKLKPSWLLQAEIYSKATNLPVEYHSVSRAKVPKVMTALESDELVTYPDDNRFENLMGTAAMMAEQIAWYYTRYGPDVPWPTLGKFADWSMAFSPCQMCGWRSTCPAWLGQS